MAGVAWQAIFAWSLRPSQLVQRRALLARRIVIDASDGDLGITILCQAMLYCIRQCYGMSIGTPSSPRRSPRRAPKGVQECFKRALHGVPGGEAVG